MAGVHVSSIRRWEARGVLTPVRIHQGRREVVRIRASDLTEVVGQQPPSRSGPPPPAAATPNPPPPPPVAAPKSARPGAPGRVRGRPRPTLLAPALVSAVIASLAAGILMGRSAPIPLVPARAQPAVTSAEAREPVRVCVASWYQSGRVTATGERYDPDELTAASRSLPFGTRLLVTEVSTNRSVVVRINDRGPYVDGRCLDLSRGAFSLIAPTGEGLIMVRLETLPQLPA